MNLYLLTQDVNDNYDTYDSVVVAANSEDEARHMSPKDSYMDDKYFIKTCWAEPEFVKVEYIGMALSTIQEPKVILASFNAG